MNHKDVIQRGKEVVRIETQAISELENRINDSFGKAVDIIHQAKGRVIVTGIAASPSATF